MNALWLPLLFLQALPVFYESAENEWRTLEIQDRALLEYRLYSRAGEPSEIFFRYDIRSGDLVEKQEADSGRRLISVGPGKHLWRPHPEAKKSLESFFIDSIADIGIRFQISPHLQRSPDGDLRPERMDELLEKTLLRSDASIQSLDELISKTEAQVKETRDLIFKPIDYPGLKNFAKRLKSNDVVEPLISRISETESRFDAFVLYPLITFRSRGDEFREALRDYASGPPRFPIEWMTSSRGKFDLSVRLSLVMCLTHNHLLESLLIQGAALTNGLKDAWNLALDLNQAYIQERLFWIKSAPSLRRIDPESPPLASTDFLLRRRAWEVHINLQSLIAGFPIATDHWLPYPKVYHYYGAFLFAARLSKENSVPESLIIDAAESVGIAYKLKTIGFNKAEIQKIRKLYRAGASDFLLMKSQIE